jgi:hypothetical protein
MRYSSIVLQLIVITCWTTSNDSFSLFGVPQFKRNSFFQQDLSRPHPPDGPPPKDLLNKEAYFTTNASTSNATKNGVPVTAVDAPWLSQEERMQLDGAKDAATVATNKAAKQFVDSIVVSFRSTGCNYS